MVEWTPTLVCAVLSRPIADRSSLIWFWTLFLCNLFLYRLHTPEGSLKKKRRKKQNKVMFVPGLTTVLLISVLVSVFLFVCWFECGKH